MSTPTPVDGNPFAPDPAPDTTPDPAVPYGTPAAPRVAVRGAAHLEVDPELARVGISVGARGPDRRTTLDDLTRRNRAVLDLLARYDDVTTETGAFSVTPELVKGGRGERVRAYHGRVHLTVEMADFTTLGELTTRLADQELTQVSGPWWRLRTDSPAHARARQEAVHDAVRRAREYAEALGTRLVALVELADIGAEQVAVPYPAAAAGLPPGVRAAYGGAPTEAPPLDLEPQRQTVRAQVNARFTMAPPRL
ncbi:SIMPL domain-containing protein [Streptomyces sp. NPDC058045]|uniref:SIMPL domain-containing protein n=1 Tax=Streptomyces sp. NPDC058045 TaxID=3346311 RepID=UPI0036E6335F